MKDQGIYIGSYPIDDQDVKDMKDIGITAVLNLQTQEDIAERGYSWTKMQQLYQNKVAKGGIQTPDLQTRRLALYPNLHRGLISSTVKYQKKSYMHLTIACMPT